MDQFILHLSFLELIVRKRFFPSVFFTSFLLHYFLGYKVIFLYRIGSVFPFTTGLRKGISNQIDDKMLSNLEDKKQGIHVNVNNVNNSRIKSELRCYNHSIKNNYLCSISFETIDEYLFLLQFISSEINYLKEKICFYLAAAVSDFYVPKEEVKNNLLSMVSID